MTFWMQLRCDGTFENDNCARETNGEPGCIFGKSSTPDTMGNYLVDSAKQSGWVKIKDDLLCPSCQNFTNQKTGV